ncbi:hypothetical protein [Streptomyces sp. NPDC007172]|uniref:hypothetical protein n=1 Tax=Streptomyces sp. NPDC007172 TaxID=3364776 RepID=UPI0036AFCE6E
MVPILTSPPPVARRGADKVTPRGNVSGVSAVIATLVNPIAGALSDRVDRRNPFVLGGAVLTAVAIAALGSLDVLLVNALFWLLGPTFMNCHQAAVTANVPDRVPEDRPGSTASAMVGPVLPGNRNQSHAYKARPCRVSAPARVAAQETGALLGDHRIAVSRVVSP